MLTKIRQNVISIIDLLYLSSSYTTHKTSWHRIMGLIFIGLMSRLLPHPPNFTAVNAIALFGVCSLGNLSRSFFTIFTTMLLSDLVTGFHSTLGFVYLSFGLIVLMGYVLKSKRSLLRTTFSLVLSSLLFFLITNFGEWFVGSMYSKNLAGLGLCYLAALPFLANNIMSTLVYGGVLFGWLAFVEQNALATTNQEALT